MGGEGSLGKALQSVGHNNNTVAMMGGILYTGNTLQNWTPCCRVRTRNDFCNEQQQQHKLDREIMDLEAALKGSYLNSTAVHKWLHICMDVRRYSMCILLFPLLLFYFHHYYYYYYCCCFLHVPSCSLLLTICKTNKMYKYMFKGQLRSIQTLFPINSSAYCPQG